MTTPSSQPEGGHGADTVPPLLDLDDRRCTDPHLAGGKAALLSLGRAAGLPVLAGIVVSAHVSAPYLSRGAEILARRGSGGARLEVSTASLDEELAARLRQRAASLGETLVVRSSSVLEVASEWSGAFTSYLDLAPQEVARGVTGCWASAFGVAALERYAASGKEPGEAEMAVLIQAALDPSFGGTARLQGDVVVITAVAGSPAPLVQGWEPGVQAHLHLDGHVDGEAARELVGDTLLRSVARLLRRAQAVLGATGCEWAAVGDETYLLQFTRTRTVEPSPPPVMGDLAMTPAARVAALVRRYPGPLGEALVLPWALGAAPTDLADPSPLDLPPLHAFAEATEQASRLTAEVWSLPRGEAGRAARQVLATLRGPQPGWAQIESLSAPDLASARRVLGYLATVREAVATAGAVTWPETAWYLEPERVQEVLEGGPVTKLQRVGYGRWEPFDAAVVMAEGREVKGAPAATGIGCGRLCWIAEPEHTAKFRPRDVIAAPYPTPNLAALLWDASAVVTVGGGPAAHLFESARALGVPAVSGVHLDEALRRAPGDGKFAVAVDGAAGSVYLSEW